MNEKIPCPYMGDGYDVELARLDSYVANYIGITPTKYKSEHARECPPVELAQEMQRLMSADHRALYGDFFKKSGVDLNYSNLTELIISYKIRAAKAPKEYGGVPEADLKSFFSSGQSRHFESIRDDIVNNTDSRAISRLYIEMTEEYIRYFGVEPWEGARFTTRFIEKVLPLIAFKIQNTPELQGLDRRDGFIEVLLQIKNDDLIEHFTLIQKDLDKGLQLGQAFNHALNQLLVPLVFSDIPELELYEEDFKYLCKAYHLGERPYSENEISVAQELLDKDPYLKTAIIVFHMEIVDHISKHLFVNKERIAHTMEHFTEIYIGALDEHEKFYLIPNPKLLSVISKNVVPAIARSYLSSVFPGSLSTDEIESGCASVKQLRLFQTMIGEFHQGSNSETVKLKSFFSQTCPAMKPFLDALVHILPKIFDQLSTKKLIINI